MLGRLREAVGRALSSLRGTASRAKRPPKSRRIQICPVCGSVKVRLLTPATIGFAPPVYLCESCGYRGTLLAEVDVEEYLRSKRE